MNHRSNTRVLVTGANGFVGSAILAHCSLNAIPTVGVVRDVGRQGGLVSAPPLESHAQWSSLFAEIDVLIHAAARVHVMKETAADPLAVFREVNTEGTLRLARQAAMGGVRRFIFLSTIKVNGEQTPEGRPFTAADSLSPMDAYARSKAEAEEGLMSLAADTGMEVVIIRPPLVYGPGVKGNFSSMAQWLKRGIPLPLGGITHNLRSFVALDNLVDLIGLCIEHPAAADQVFLVSDGEDLSTADLLRRLASALGAKAYLFPLPTWALTAGAALLGKGALLQRLCGNLQVDMTKTGQLLWWHPAISVDEGLQRFAAGFRP